MSALVASIIIVFASLSGVLFTYRHTEAWMQRNLRYLVSFASGVFLLIAYSLVEEALESAMPTWHVLAMAFVGVCVLTILSRTLRAHHHHGPQSHRHSKIDAHALMASDAIHNIIDGLLLVTVFAISTPVGIATAVGVFLHEVVQGISDFFVFREAGYSSRKALTYNVMINSTVVVGVGIGMVAGELFSLTLPYIAAFSAGAFMYVIVNDLLPSSWRDMIRNKTAWRHGTAFVCGMLLLAAIGAISPHTHDGHTDDPTQPEHHHDDGHGH